MRESRRPHETVMTRRRILHVMGQQGHISCAELNKSFVSRNQFYDSGILGMEKPSDKWHMGRFELKDFLARLGKSDVYRWNPEAALQQGNPLMQMWLPEEVEDGAYRILIDVVREDCDGTARNRAYLADHVSWIPMKKIGKMLNQMVADRIMEKNKGYYRLKRYSVNGVLQLEPKQWKELYLYLDFVKNVQPIQMPFYLLQRKVRAFLLEEAKRRNREEEALRFLREETPICYRHRYLFTVLDEQVALAELIAWQQKRELKGTWDMSFLLSEKFLDRVKRENGKRDVLWLDKEEEEYCREYRGGYTADGEHTLIYDCRTGELLTETVGGDRTRRGALEYAVLSRQEIAGIVEYGPGDQPCFIDDPQIPFSRMMMEALDNMLRLPHTGLFLSDALIDRIAQKLDGWKSESPGGFQPRWQIDKVRYDGRSGKKNEWRQDKNKAYRWLHKVLHAIKEKRRLGNFYPKQIEYSLYHDAFRVIGYDRQKNRWRAVDMEELATEDAEQGNLDFAEDGCCSQNICNDESWREEIFSDGYELEMEITSRYQGLKNLNQMEIIQRSGMFWNEVRQKELLDEDCTVTNITVRGMREDCVEDLAFLLGLPWKEEYQNIEGSIPEVGDQCLYRYGEQGEFIDRKIHIVLKTDRELLGEVANKVREFPINTVGVYVDSCDIEIRGKDDSDESGLLQSLY